MKHPFRLLPQIVLLICCLSSTQVQAQSRIQTGADQIQRYLPLLKGKRVAILCNQTSRVGSELLVDTLLRLHVDITRIFGPEHGFRGKADAGAGVADFTDPQTGIPVVSLYGRHQMPDAADLRNVDIMIYDLQDVGCRFYTYIITLQHYLDAAARYHKEVLILDRPDPNGYFVDGPVLNPKFKSGVGSQQIPVVYGMTPGEYARMLVGEHWLDPGFGSPRLRIIPCKNYTHDSLYQLPVNPSPNLPDMTSVYLYPSLCFFEGTICSVGRGTAHPFQLFGHPSFPDSLMRFIPRSMPGATRPPLMNRVCYGIRVATSPSQALERSGGQLRLRWLLDAYRWSGASAAFFHPFFDLLAGTGQLRTEILQGWSAKRIHASWQPAIRRFMRIRRKYLLYPDFHRGPHRMSVN